MKWRRYDEAVEIVQKRFQYFPHVFRWRGRHFGVQSVDRCWTLSRSRWNHRAERHYFRLRCLEGLFEIYQDPRSNTWCLGRALLGRDEKLRLSQEMKRTPLTRHETASAGRFRVARTRRSLLRTIVSHVMRSDTGVGRFARV